MTRETVTIVREVRYTNPDGSFAGSQTEVMDVVIEWPGEPDTAIVNGYRVDGDWRIVTRKDAIRA